MRVLGIETSCDETAVALVERGPIVTTILAQAISSQISLHQKYGGVVPELATREHLRNLPKMVPALLGEACQALAGLHAVAATEGPGLASSLLIGHSYARALAVALDKPMVGVNHLEGHLFSPFIGAGLPVVFPFIGLIVSGGHTLLVEVKGWNRYRKLGGTVDDAAGEAFDKVARLLGLSYPGGPEIEKMARGGDPTAYDLPRSFPQRDKLDFSFSGLKTAARLIYEKELAAQPEMKWLPSLCASFQEAIVDVLTQKSVSATVRSGFRKLTASGGVICNGRLRQRLERECRTHGIEFLATAPAFCTDNAGMIAGVAAEKLAAGLAPHVGDDINPNLSLFSA